MRAVVFSKVGQGVETSVELHDAGLPHRIDGRICDLGKALAEEGIHRPWRMRQRC